MAQALVGAGIFLVEYRRETNTLHCGHCNAELVQAYEVYAYERPPHCYCGAVPPPCEATAAPETLEDE